MPKSTSTTGGEPPATAPTALTFSSVIEWVNQRVDALAQRAAQANLAGAGVALRLRGRAATTALRELADSERRLNAMDDHIQALEHMGRRTAPAPAAAHGSAPPLRRLSHLEVQLRLVRARAKGAEALEVEKEAIRRESGFGVRRVASLLAHTNGDYKQRWAKKALRSVAGKDRDALATELEGYGYGPAKELLRLARK